MNDHLEPVVLNALVDGELNDDELRDAKQHLDHCLACSWAALDGCLLKRASSKVGHHYPMSKGFGARMKTMLNSPGVEGGAGKTAGLRVRRRAHWNAVSGWAVAAILLFTVGAGAIIGVVSLKRTATSERDTMMAEVMDDHVAMMAANQPPQILSSDRHTIKPWFQGKLPFSFNLPKTLPADIALTGANLKYLRNQPVAQLIFLIGKHNASVFVERKASRIDSDFSATRDGFHVIGFAAQDLELIAVSDVEQGRLVELGRLLKDSQTAP